MYFTPEIIQWHAGQSGDHITRMYFKNFIPESLREKTDHSKDYITSIYWMHFIRRVYVNDLTARRSYHQNLLNAVQAENSTRTPYRTGQEIVLPEFIKCTSMSIRRFYGADWPVRKSYHNSLLNVLHSGHFGGTDWPGFPWEGPSGTFRSSNPWT